MLTIQEIKNAKPTDKQRKLFDRDGLYLVVTPAGGKLWRGKYRVNGREKNALPDPLHTQEVTRFATEVDIRRIEERVRHLEESQATLLNQIGRDKTEIMEAATRGRAHINEQIAQLAAVCNRTAGTVQELSAQIATLFKSALRPKD